MVRDFADICYHSYPSYLKELRESPTCSELQRLRYRSCHHLCKPWFFSLRKTEEMEPYSP